MLSLFKAYIQLPHRRSTGSRKSGKGFAVRRSFALEKTGFRMALRPEHKGRRQRCVMKLLLAKDPRPRFRLPSREHCLAKIGQQLMRQDPLYYTLHAALRPDKHWRLVSYPYYVKYAKEGDSTYFKHIDINVPYLLTHGRGCH